METEKVRCCACKKDFQVCDTSEIWNGEHICKWCEDEWYHAVTDGLNDDYRTEIEAGYAHTK